MTDLTAVLVHMGHRGIRVRKAADAVAGDAWPGVWDNAAKMQQALDTLVEWPAASTPPLAADVIAAVPGYEAAVAAGAAASVKRAEIQKLRDGGEKIAFILVELIDKLLAKGAITAADLTPAVCQEYQDVKAIADRVKP